MLCGLSYLHSKNQLHRDIKPANVLLNMKGEVKLSDFGISRTLPSETLFTRTAVGTRSYMSPERIEGSSYGFKGDIWGIGLTLYELATGTYPYQGRSELDLLRDFEKVGSPQLPTVYSEDFQDFLNCALELEEEKRWSAVELTV
jgi:serine/threonine protein kinase